MAPSNLLLSALAILATAIPYTTAAVFGSTGCKKPLSPNFSTEDQSSQLLTFASSGGQREAFVHLPVDYDQKDPTQLILAFHSSDSDAKLFEKTTALSFEEHSKDTIVVYPQAISNTWTGSPDAPLTSEHSDLTFVTDLLDQLEATFCIDRSRIYATGHDTGGGLVGLLACHPFLSQRIAAFAPVSATFYESSALKQPLFDYCSPGRKHVPILSVHGDQDEVAPYDGSSTEDSDSTNLSPRTQSIPGYLAGWAQRNDCDPDKKGNISASIYLDKVTRSTFRCGEGRTRLVEAWLMKESGHTWYRRVVGDIANDDFKILDASEIVTKWFARHQLPDEFLSASAETDEKRPENPEDERHGTEPVAEKMNDPEEPPYKKEEEGKHDHGQAYLDVGDIKIEHFGTLEGPDVTRTTTHTNIISIAVQKFETKNEEGVWTTHDGSSSPSSAPKASEEAAPRDEL